MQTRDMCRFFKRVVARAFIAQGPHVAGVIWRGLMNGRGTRCGGLDHINHCRKYLVLHLDQLGGIPRS